MFEMGQILKIGFVYMETNGTNKKFDFPPQNEPHTAKLSFSGVLKHFRRNLLKSSHLRQKSDIS